MIDGTGIKLSNMKTPHALIFLPLVFIISFTNSFPLKKEKQENFIHLEGAKFVVGDTIKAQFASEKFEMLHTNFGECGKGNSAMFYVEYQGDSTKNVSNTIFCDYLITEYWYESKGILKFMVYEPGTYRLSVWTKEKGTIIENEAERFKNEYKSEWFQVE